MVGHIRRPGYPDRGIGLIDFPVRRDPRVMLANARAAKEPARRRSKRSAASAISRLRVPTAASASIS